MGPILIRSFYCFSKLSPQQTEAFAQRLRDLGSRLGVRGIVLIADEGCNAGLSGKPEAVDAVTDLVREILSVADLDHKDSYASEHPYPKLKVTVKEEIVTTGFPRVQLPEGSGYLSPAEWEIKLQDPEVIVLDTRNSYETKLGMFRGALDPQIESFADFPAYVSSSGIARDKTVLMYCTGGIRCEKASIQMRELGYQHVYQLRGGILRYLEQFPHKSFEGECFVFDERIAVTQELAPSAQYQLCVHCGEPTAHRIVCSRCGENGIVCDCCAIMPARNTCSKDCAYHVRRSLGDNSAELAPG